MANPSAFGAVSATEIISPFDIDKPERLNTLMRVRGDQGLGAMRIIESLGWSSPVAQETYSHDEEDWIHATFHSNALVGAPGVGAAGTYRLQSADLTATPLFKFYPRLWDTVMFSNEVTGQITGIAGAGTANVDITVTPNDGADDIGQVEAGEEIIIISKAFSEGSEQPAGALTGTFSYSNDLQIVKETFEATGTEMTNQKWFEKMSDGKGITAYYLKGQMDTYYRLNLAIDGALLFQKRTTANQITDGATSRDLTTTEGAIPFARRLGTTKTYTPGSYTVSKFNSSVKTFDKEFTGRYICCLNGIDLNLEISDTLVDYFSNTNIDFTRKQATSDLFGGDAGLAASVDFSYLQKGEFVFAFKKLKQLSHPRLYGATGYGHAGLGLWFPLSKKKNKKTNKMVPSFGMRYKQLGEHNRKTQVWTVSGAGPSAGTFVQTADLHKYCLRAHVGFHGIGGNQYQVIDPGI